MKTLILSVWIGTGCLPLTLRAAESESRIPKPDIPKSWDDAAIADLEIPLAQPAYSPKHVSADYYYRIPVRPIYKSHPVYAPGKEQPGYLNRLKQEKPVILWDDKGNRPRLQTEADWIKAGEAVFDAAMSYDQVGLAITNGMTPNGITFPADVLDPNWYRVTGTPITSDGRLPFYAYVVREKGKVELAQFSCAMCHTRVMADGSVIKGAQGNFPFDRARAFNHRKEGYPGDTVRGVERGLFAVPWLHPDVHARFEQMPLKEIASFHDAIPPGVLGRTRTSPFYPVRIPDLIGVKDRRYLDATGLQKHRSIEDMMRYAALNQGADDLASYGGFIPIDVPKFEKRPAPESEDVGGRYSDEQLYALALYLYSLKPPLNPNEPKKPEQKASVARGEKVFMNSDNRCATCHKPETSYTNNKLLPVEGFAVPADHRDKYDIGKRIDTDPNLTLKTRRGTGYYKVPSLRGVWYRGPFEHNGSCATLEDWFNPARTKDTYVPTGWKGPPGTKTRAVNGHEYGLHLSEKDRKALIAFLKTL